MGSCMPGSSWTACPQQVVSFLRHILLISRERVALDDPTQVLLVLTFFDTVNEPPISLL